MKYNKKDMEVLLVFLEYCHSFEGAGLARLRHISKVSGYTLPELIFVHAIMLIVDKHGARICYHYNEHDRDPSSELEVYKFYVSVLRDGDEWELIGRE